MLQTKHADLPVRKGDTHLCFECGDVISGDEEEDQTNSDAASTGSDSKRARKCTTCRQESISYTNGDSSPAVSEESAAPTKPGHRHTCSHCGKAFADSSKLKRHVKIHLGMRDFKCKTCGKGFIEACSLRRHESVHSDVKPHNCSLCGKGFTDSSGLKKHLVKCNGQVKDAGKVTDSKVNDEQVRDTFKGTNCDKFKDGRIKNMTKATDSGKVKDVDMVTDVEATRVKMVEKDFVDNGEAGNLESPHAEDGCERKVRSVFKAQGSSQNAKGLHDQTESSIKTSTKLASLSYFDAFASRFHRSSMVYICRECGKSCDDELSLRRHLLTHGSTSGSLGGPVSCQLCGKMFVSLQFLHKHIKNHADHSGLMFHAGIPSSEPSSSVGVRPVFRGNSDPLSSTTCRAPSRTPPSSKTANVSLDLATHVDATPGLTATERRAGASTPSGDAVSGSSPMPDPPDGCDTNCEVCGKVFADASSLKRHARLHTEQQHQFPCENCDKVFGDQGSLKRHWLRGCRNIAMATGGEAAAGRQRIMAEVGAEDHFACTQCRMVSTHTCMHTRTHTSTHTHMHTHTHMYAHAHAHTHMHTCTHAHTQAHYTYTHTHAHY